MSVQINQRISIRNPRTGEYDYQISSPTLEELTSNCDELRNAQSQWSEMGLEGRAAVLREWKGALEKHKDELIKALVEDTGRLNESIREFENIGKWVDRWIEVAENIVVNKHSIQSKYVPILEMSHNSTPYSLVGVISPWNFPMSLSTMDMIPALLAGSAVIVKPSEVTPRFVEPMQKTVDEVPELAKVLKYVVGAGDVGQQLIDQVDLIVFTGSEQTGRKVAAQAGGNLIPAFLELGGKDPAIVLQDANITNAVKGILFGGICGMGHQCFSIERVYVDEKIHDRFIEELVEEANKIELAYNVGEGHLGPIIYDKQVSIIESHLKDAVSKGAEIVCGGEIENRNNSFWLRPTILKNVDHTMKIMLEETFGPIMPVMRYSKEEEAIALANDSTFGLTSAVFSEDIDKSKVVASQLKIGGVTINDAGVLPFVITESGDYTAFNNSGLGESRFGEKGIKRFLQNQLVITKNTETPSPWWY